MRYFGSYHIWDPQQFAVAVKEVRRLQAAYGGKHATINTVKIHFDGSPFLGTDCQAAPTATATSLVDYSRVITDSDTLA